jgi:hypothetical protein
VDDRERLIISSRLIDFYSRKISSKDYACFELEHLLICNYNKSNPNLLSVRKDSTSLLSSNEATQEKMLQNLGEILDILLGEYLAETKE